MIPRRRLAVWAGQAAALLFGAMIIVLQWYVRPEAGNIPLPQSDLTGYSDADLVALATNLGPDVLATYRAVLTWLDPAFIACFSMFATLALWPRRLVRLLPTAFAVADVTENALILRGLTGPVALPVAQTSAAYPFTLLKFVLFTACLAVLLWAWWQNRVLPEGKDH